MKLTRVKPDAAKRAMNWDFTNIRKRYQKETGKTGKDAQLMERELKRFLIVCAESGTGKIGMKGPVDEMWHTFILFTKDYARFCDQLCGHMIHHEPTIDDGKPKRMKKGDNPYVRFHKIYEAVFEQKAPEQVWPAIESNSWISCIDCIECIECIEDCIFTDDDSEPPEGGEGTDPDKDSDSDTDDDADSDGPATEGEFRRGGFGR